MRLSWRDGADSVRLADEEGMFPFGGTFCPVDELSVSARRESDVLVAA